MIKIFVLKIMLLKKENKTMCDKRNKSSKCFRGIILKAKMC